MVDFGFELKTITPRDSVTGIYGKERISGFSLTLFNRTFNFDKLFGWRF